jgi:sugar lactone lactonase YvrE
MRMRLFTVVDSRRRLIFVFALVPLIAALWPAWLASAAPRQTLIPLPGASSTEGIAIGNGATFFAGDLFRGDIFRGDLQRGTAESFIRAPAGRMAVGMKEDQTNGLLFVAGGTTGQAYIYSTDTRSSVATYQLGDPAAGTFINDVTIVHGVGAWFTDSAQPKLYLIPIGPNGTLGAARTLALSGPAANTSFGINLNGIVATPDGKTLIVAHTDLGQLFTVDPATGASALIAGVSVPNVDGILLEAGRLLAVQNVDNRVDIVRLSSDLTSGVIEKVITNPQFEVPTTIARHGNELAVVNAKFDTGFPPTATQYEVVVFER